VDFDIVPQGVPNIGEIRLKIEGAEKSYRNGPEPTWGFRWPGDKTHGVQLQLIGQGGTVVGKFERGGDWAPFHLIDQARSTGAVGTSHRYEWQFSPATTLKMTIRVNRMNSMLVGARRPLNCPPGVR